jgi:small subunit ribosomal protein S1
MSDNSPNNENFADLFKDEDISKKQFTPGQKIQAVVVDITQDSIFLDAGGKSEGFVDRKELEDETGDVTVETGDTIEVYFLSSARNEMLFTTKIGGGSTSRAHLEEAYRSNIPLEGFIKKEIKGGFEVTIAGNVRSFCPFSQMDIKRISDPEDYVDQHMLFKITEYKENGRNIIISRRIILEEEREEKKEALKETLQEGMAVKGSITSIQKFGAFVDIDGIEGLIPISEIGWSRIENVNEVLSEGQDVEVVVMKLDWENDRFSFSLKQALPDPWQNLSQKLPVGSSHSGTVVRLTKFGAFVNLAEGIDGLIHISKLGGGRRINHPKEVLDEGQTVEVKIEDIDAEQKRLSLALVGEMNGEESDSENGEKDIKEFQAKQDKTAAGTPMGTLGDILKTKLAEKGKK